MFYATVIIAYFCLIIPLLGFAAMAVLMPDASFFKVGAGGAFNKITDLIGGPNMAAVHLASAIGGPVLLGFIFSRIVRDHFWPSSRALAFGRGIGNQPRYLRSSHRLKATLLKKWK